MDAAVMLFSVLPLLALIVIALFLEQKRPLYPQPLKSARLNLIYALFYTAAQALIVPTLSG